MSSGLVLVPTPVRAALAVSGWAALATTALPAGSPVRVLVTFAFVLFCPGIATVRLVQVLLLRVRARPMDLLESFVVAVGASLALGALVSEAFYLAQSFSTTRALAALAAITSVAALLPVRGRPITPREPG